MIGLHLVRPGTVLRSGPLPRIPVDLRAGCAGLHLGPPVDPAFAATGEHLRPRRDELQLPRAQLIRAQLVARTDRRVAIPPAPPEP